MTLTKDEPDLSTKRIENARAIRKKLKECTQKSHTLAVKRSLGGSAYEVIGKSGHYHEKIKTNEEGRQMLYIVNLGDTFRNHKHYVAFSANDIRAIEVKRKSSVSKAENVTLILK